MLPLFSCLVFLVLFTLFILFNLRPFVRVDALTVTVSRAYLMTTEVDGDDDDDNSDGDDDDGDNDDDDASISSEVVLRVIYQERLSSQ